MLKVLLLLTGIMAVISAQVLHRTNHLYLTMTGVPALLSAVRIANGKPIKQLLPTQIIKMVLRWFSQ